MIFLENFKLKKSKIPKFFKFSVKEWISRKKEIIKILSKELNKNIIIRSSYILEDNEKYSMAGEFEGFPNVKNSQKEIFASVSNLIKQYKKKKKSFLKKRNYFSEHDFEYQIKWVLTNYCIKDGSFYYVINYDDISGSTDSVTSGSKTGGRVINIFRDEITGIRSKKVKKGYRVD